MQGRISPGRTAGLRAEVTVASPLVEEIVIVGAGLAGASLAWALAERGRAPLLVESRTVGGGGATAHSRGMVRFYDDEPRLAARNRDGIALWTEVETARPGIFRRSGLVYAPGCESLAKVRHFAETRGDRTYPVELIDGSAARSFCPMLHSGLTEPGRPLLWERRAGYVDPRAGARFFADEAVRLGASLLEGCRVDEVVGRSGTVRISVDAGAIAARQVILALGAATPRVAPARGLVCRSIHLTSFRDLPSRVPEVCIIDEVSKGYLRPEGPGRYYVGGAPQVEAASPDRLETRPEASNSANLALARRLLQTVPSSMIAGHPGHDGYTPDLLPLVTRPADNAGIGLFTGFSGRGAKYIPAFARHYASTMLDGSP